ncbi:EAL domain-containing protein [Vibrio sinaloensis]|uniref:EAL domain-containing protein n=1 Tax=Photobacterium sp. (strain ATCC 43367) TaxID=379097 RepID=UPI002F3ED349
MILTSKSQFQHCLETTAEHQFIANYNGLTLSSVYQPIFDIDESIFGVEALVRIKDAQIVMELIELDCENLRYLKTAMEKLNQNGFNVAIDDFGANASTEARVLQVKPHILKMDRSLLLQYCSGDHAPLLSALHLAKRIGAQTVIEGIETAQQLNAMRALNIDLYQGFHLAMPVMLPAKIVVPSN